MIHPAGDKRVALNVVAGMPLTQGCVLKFVPLLPDDGSGRLMVIKANATADFTVWGTFVAYYITPDSQDTEFTGKPESTDFTLNTATGISGGINNIPSGSELVALGGRNSLLRLDRNALTGPPTNLVPYVASTQLRVNSTSGLLDTVASGDLAAIAAVVVENDGPTLVVLLI